MAGQYEVLREQKLQRERLAERVRTATSAVDVSAPQTMSMDHVFRKLKREQLEEERYCQIDRENHILLARVSEMMRRPPKLEKRADAAAPRSATVPPGKKMEMDRVAMENRLLRARVQNVPAVYPKSDMKAHQERSQQHFKICQEYPTVLKKPRRSLSSTDPFQSMSTQHSGQAPAKAWKHVLQEGRVISGAYYFLEMETDGCELRISAHHTDQQRTLNLAIDERLHLKLSWAAGGDYSRLAQQLRVEGDRLKLRVAKRGPA